MSRYVKGYSKKEIKAMWDNDMLVKCPMCNRLYFKPKEHVKVFPYYNVSKCSECEQVKLNTKGKE